MTKPVFLVYIAHLLWIALRRKPKQGLIDEFDRHEICVGGKVVIRYSLGNSRLDGLEAILAERDKCDTREAREEWDAKLDAFRWSNPVLRRFEDPEIEFLLGRESAYSIVIEEPVRDIREDGPFIVPDVRFDNEEHPVVKVSVRWERRPGSSLAVGLFTRGQSHAVVIDLGQEDGGLHYYRILADTGKIDDLSAMLQELTDCVWSLINPKRS